MKISDYRLVERLQRVNPAIDAASTRKLVDDYLKRDYIGLVRTFNLDRTIFIIGASEVVRRDLVEYLDSELTKMGIDRDNK